MEILSAISTDTECAPSDALCVMLAEAKGVRRRAADRSLCMPRDVALFMPPILHADCN